MSIRRARPPKSDTNPLTQIRTHVLYSPLIGPSTTLNPKEEPKPRREPQPRPIRGLNVPAHPKGRPTRRPSAQAKSGTSAYGGPPSPHTKGPAHPPPTTQAMEGPQTMLGMPRPGPLPIQRFPLPDAFTPAHCVPILPGRSTDPRSSKALVSLFVPPSPPSVSTTDAPGRRLCSPSAVRSSAAAGGICPTQP